MHSIQISPSASKEELYQLLLPQIAELVTNEPDPIANMANVTAVLKEAFGFWWVGFYLVRGNELVLGPFQGPVACTRIGYGKGVCGTAWQMGEVQIVPDVLLFPGHIACSTHSRSEIVLPLFKNQSVVAVLDIDSQYLDAFDETDQRYLEKMCAYLDF
ncbi:MAG: GAF domain-containing protein [Prevotellaceae bacterium]|jgi:GAF domain-containing protein|nr:GAF domain-containing protein [Prevotellaceae bacterium]